MRENSDGDWPILRETGLYSSYDQTDGTFILLCPLHEVLRLDSGLAQANFGPVPGGRLPAGDGHA